MGVYHVEYIIDTDNIYVAIVDLTDEQVAALITYGHQLANNRGLNKTYPCLRVGIILLAIPGLSPNDVFLICQDLIKNYEQYETLMFRASLEKRGLWPWPY